MCCFSRPVRHVSKTRIFARAEPGGLQVLAYQMSFSADEDLAMILPLPVAEGSGEGAVTFVDVSGYPGLFDDLDRAFPTLFAGPKGGFLAARSFPAQSRLIVHDVGDFEASFVPTRADFGRLDPRFRLPDSIWDHLGSYDDWGFAVFKLRPPRRGFFARLFGRKGPEQGVHPMAFRFPRRKGSPLFFPTVHVHDGEVHPEAEFDHTLYAQLDADAEAAEPLWERSEGEAGQHVDVDRARGLIEGGRPLLRQLLIGRLPNRDTFLGGG